MLSTASHAAFCNRCNATLHVKHHARLCCISGMQVFIVLFFKKGNLERVYLRFTNLSRLFVRNFLGYKSPVINKNIFSKLSFTVMLIFFFFFSYICGLIQRTRVKEKGNLDLSKIYPILEQASANSVV